MQRILVVEDDEPIGRLLDSALRANGYDVSWARTAAAALAQSQVGSFDLVMLDLGLPKNVSCMFKKRSKIFTGD